MKKKRTLDQIAKELQGARRILDCYSSPFPDAIERKRKQEQVTLVNRLEKELLEHTSALATIRAKEPQPSRDPGVAD